MKIAIVGAGFSGLATAWYLIQKKHHVTLFDQIGPGGGASGIAAGLLHTYAGLHSKLNQEGKEGYATTCLLLKEAEKALNKPVADYNGLLRIATTTSQEKDYKICADKFSDVKWLSANECVKLIPGTIEKPGILIENAITVYSQEYTQGLWLACQNLGGQFAKKEIQDLNELNEFDVKIFTTGSATSRLNMFKHLPISLVKGQILEFEWPTNIPPLSKPINSQAYLIMTPDKKRCIAGATFERDFSSEQPDIKTAITDILPKTAAFFPPILDAKIIGCRAGIRVSTPTHLPLMKEVFPKCWVLTGMGSKGLLYHALYAERLSSKICEEALKN